VDKHTLSVSVFFIFIIRHPNRMVSAPYYIVICEVSGRTYFPTESHKTQDFRRKSIEHKMYVLVLSTTSVSNTSDSKKSFSEIL